MWCRAHTINTFKKQLDKHQEVIFNYSPDFTGTGSLPVMLFKMLAKEVLFYLRSWEQIELNLQGGPKNLTQYFVRLNFIKY